jgi:pilus assembly protein CpaF
VSTRLVDQLHGVASVATPDTPYQQVKQRLHSELVAALDLQALQHLDQVEIDRQLRQTLTSMLQAQPQPLTREDQDRMVGDILDEVLGYGPIERLLHSPDVSDILINGPDKVYIERGGKLERVPVRFRDTAHLMHVINRIVGAVGRRVDESTPMVDARLPADGSRFNAVISPIALDGPLVSIRRFGVNPIRREDLLRLGSIPGPILELLEGMVKAKTNILVSGGTGSGKTTFLNVLSSFIPPDERIVTIEDSAELRLQQDHVARLETRPPNLEGQGEITARALVRNALRMRPDRIIVGEIRGDEAVDMLQAMNTGHEGSISTIHANSPRHALGRLQTMVGLGLGNMPGQAIREMIADALHLIVQIARHADGCRRVVSITEITGLESGVVAAQEIFRFRQRTVDASGRVRGTFESTGVRPNLARRMEAYGLTVPQEALTLSVEI